MDDYDLGKDAGYNGRFTLLIEQRKNYEFQRGFAAGREQALAEHRATYSDSTMWSDGMARGADARQLKDRSDW